MKMIDSSITLKETVLKFLRNGNSQILKNSKTCAMSAA